MRSCSLRCRCFVTPGAVASCKANCTTGDLHRMERARFVIQTVQSIDSTRIGHNAPFQVGILFLFSFILFVHLLLQPSSPGPLLFYFYSRSNLSLSSVKARVSISNGMLFLRNKSVRWAVYPVSFASRFQACISHLGLIFYCLKLYAITRIFSSPGSCTYTTVRATFL